MRRILIGLIFSATLAWASVASAASTFQITGGGDGHGVGMSQYGALGYAMHGEDYRFILAHYYEGTALGSTDPNQTVRVLIATGRPSFSGATRAGGTRLNAAKTYSVRGLAGGSLQLVGPSGKKLARSSSTLTVTGPGPLSLAGHGQYRGSFELRAVGGQVQTVDAIGLDDYVRGVISAEMPSSWPAQALEAQAVAARTYAITSNVQGNGYQLYPDTRSQMYRGVAAEGPATDAAVAATRGQIVTYAGLPATTYFFASSGGYTEDIQNVWLGVSPEGWLQGVPDPYDAAGGDPYHRWSYKMTLSAAKAKLGRLVRGQLRGINVTKRGVSPRVVSAVVVGTKGQTSVTGPQLQAIFRLDSTYMSFTSVSSVPGAPPPPTGPSSGGASPLAAAAPQVRGIVRHFFLAVAGRALSKAVPPGLHGTVFPARAGSVATVQVQTKHGWRTIRHIRLGRRGAYRVQLSARRTYRLVYRGVAGPAVPS
jgi:stage II sporulation protein D